MARQWQEPLMPDQPRKIVVPCPMPVCAWQVEVSPSNLAELGTSYGLYMDHVISEHPEIVQTLLTLGGH